MLEPDTPAWVDGMCSGEDFCQSEFDVSFGLGIDEDKAEPILETLCDEKFCCRKRKEVSAPVWIKDSVCRLDLTDPYRIEIGLDIYTLGNETLLCDPEYIKCLGINGIASLGAFDEQILPLTWGWEEESQFGSLQYPAGFARRLTSTASGDVSDFHLPSCFLSVDLHHISTVASQCNDFSHKISDQSLSQ